MNGQGAFVREIELRGHILDSGVFGRVLELIMDNEFARYTIDNFSVGKTATESSTARLRIEAESAAALEDLLDKLRDIGAFVADDTDALTEPAPQSGVRVHVQRRLEREAQGALGCRNRARAARDARGR